MVVTKLKKIKNENMIHKLQESLEHLKILTVNNINKNLASSGSESWKKYYLQNKKNLGPNHSFSIYLFFSNFYGWMLLGNVFRVYRYFNADLKMSPYVRVHIKILSRKFRILNARDSRVIYPHSLRNVCLQTYRNNRIC